MTRVKSFIESQLADCCPGMDVPGVGVVHNHDCPRCAVSRALPIRPCAPGEVPQPLRDLVDEKIPLTGMPARRGYVIRRRAAGAITEGYTVTLLEGIEISRVEVRTYPEAARISEEWCGGAEETALAPESQDELLARLICAARELALRNLRESVPLMPAEGLMAEIRSESCFECHMSEHLGVLRHASNCRTGRVLGIIGEMAAMVGQRVSGSASQRVSGPTALQTGGPR